MNVVYGQHAEKRKNSELCQVTQYNLDDQKIIDFALVELKGRYPEVGRVSNQECRELVYIQAGQGKVVVEGKEISLQAGDSVLIAAQEKYFWEGNMDLFIACTPAWNLAQHQQTE